MDVRKKPLALVFAVFMSLMLILGACSSSDTIEGNSNNLDSNTPDEVYEMRLVHLHPETTQQGKNANYFRDAVEEYTEGRVKVTVFPAGQLASSADREPQMVKTGAAEAMLTFSGTVSPMVPQEMIYEVPFLFDVPIGDKRLTEAVAEDKLINDAINAQAEKQGFKRLGSLPTAFGVFTVANNTRAVEKPEDAAGLKIRIAASEMYKILADSMGAFPVAIVASEVPVGLSQGVFDGLNTTLTYYHDARWHTKYITTNYAISLTIPLYVNLEWWNGLPSDLQDIIQNEVMPDVRKKAIAEVESEEKKVLELIQQEPYNVKVSTFDYNDPEVKRWIEETKQKGIDLFLSKLGDEGQTMIDQVEKYKSEFQ